MQPMFAPTFPSPQLCVGCVCACVSVCVCVCLWDVCVQQGLAPERRGCFRGGRGLPGVSLCVFVCVCARVCACLCVYHVCARVTSACSYVCTASMHVRCVSTDLPTTLLHFHVCVCTCACVCVRVHSWIWPSFASCCRRIQSFLRWVLGAGVH
jgi:hypothetical protein